jgi:hypothetical protein
MKSKRSFLTLLACSLVFSSMAAHAETTAPALDSKSASAVAETFLADYLKTLKSDARNDNEKFVAKSKLAAPEFKASYKKAMADKELDSDPVIFAQDVPITPFKAESSKVKGDTATVVVAAKYNPKEISRLKVTLVAKDGHWLVSKVARPK